MCQHPRRCNFRYSCVTASVAVYDLFTAHYFHFVIQILFEVQFTMVKIELHLFILLLMQVKKVTPPFITVGQVGLLRQAVKVEQPRLIAQLKLIKVRVAEQVIELEQVRL